MSDRLPSGPPVMPDDFESAREELLKNVEGYLDEHRRNRNGYSGKSEGLGVITEEYQGLIESIRSGDYTRIYKGASDVAVRCLWLMATIEAMHTQDLARKSEQVRKSQTPQEKAEPDIA